MSGENQIPAVHQAIVAAAVKAAVGERAVIRQIVEMPATLCRWVRTSSR